MLLQETDRELVDKIRRGDKAAFCTLVERHAQQLLGMAYSLVGDATDAEDVVQETLLETMRKLDSFEGRSTVGTWMRGILVFKASKLRRQRRRHQALPLGGDGTTGPMAGDRGDLPGPSVEAPPETGRTVAAVDSRVDAAVMLQTLSTEHREVVVLRELQQMSYGEIAEILKIPIGTVESRLYRARQELKKKFAEYSS
ncbi:MAG TPA: sigma-70 family RNA polymerase sigma factor [Tepidisphaeraceae bacterium]|nr:sigma-70 family RNA polymerase sigma factor [Tepidisphaeraceae bacterium]